MAEQERTAEIDAPLAALIAEHASHGFSGFMRSRSDGCPVYVAAVALDDALRAEHPTPCQAIMAPGRHYGPDHCVKAVGHGGWHFGERGCSWSDGACVTPPATPHADDRPTVCIAHGCFIPCRKDGEHRYTASPYWVKSVEDYQGSPVDGLTWEPAWEDTADPEPRDEGGAAWGYCLPSLGEPCGGCHRCTPPTPTDEES